MYTNVKFCTKDFSFTTNVQCVPQRGELFMIDDETYRVGNMSYRTSKNKPMIVTPIINLVKQSKRTRKERKRKART